MKHTVLKSAACALGLVALALSASTAALAGPMYTFNTSVGTQLSNAGVITLTQNGANSVNVNVDLINPTYGFVNTGGPHTPFAFSLAGAGALSIAFTTPVGGSPFSLNTAGGSNTPYGDYGVAIDSSAGNGSANGYFGDLLFTLTRVGGLSTDDFIANAAGWYFSADLSNGTNTGAQAWTRTSTTQEVPEPLTLSLFMAGLAGVTVMRRRRTAKA
jgi:hypothetical protein